MPSYRLLKPAHRCQTPILALALAEDIERINMALTILCRLSDESIHDDRVEANREKVAVFAYLNSWHEKASSKLKGYLAEDSTWSPRRAPRTSSSRRA